MKRYLLDYEDEVFTLIMLAVVGPDVSMLPLTEILDRKIAFQQTAGTYRIEVTCHYA